MHPQYQPRDPSRRAVGIAVVIVLHLLLGYALVTGTARTAYERVKKPLQAVLVEEVIIPPPPPPPPKEIAKPQQAPQQEAPPPPFVPPPDVPPPVTSTAPTIEAAPTPPPTPAVIAPPPPPVVVAPPAPAAPTRSDIKLACPSQVTPEMPRKALQDGTQGVVKAQALIRNGAVVEVTMLSGPKVFYPAVRAAMLQYKCQSGAGDVLATQEFVFKIEE
ncbi:MAG: energy transducer TonB [Rhodoferax sp.]|nr:energy transducer TonB [Rhodoferax sp.]